MHFFLLLPLPFGLANSGERSYFVVVTDAAVVVLVVVFVSFTLVCVAAFSGAISIWFRIETIWVGGALCKYWLFCQSFCMGVRYWFEWIWQHQSCLLEAGEALSVLIDAACSFCTLSRFARSSLFFFAFSSSSSSFSFHLFLFVFYILVYIFI